MGFISESIISNIGSDVIEVYMRKCNIQRNEKESGKELRYWINDLIQKNAIEEDRFENFLFEELFWGKRKSIRIYKLDKFNQIKYTTIWMKNLKEKYEIDSVNFSNILSTHFSEKDKHKLKIASVKSEENSKGELQNIRILFVLSQTIIEKGKMTDNASYIPVEVNLRKKIMVVKAWNRIGIFDPDDKLNPQMDHILEMMSIQFGVNTQNYNLEHKKVLFNMSKKLIDDAYELIPGYSHIEKAKGIIDNFSKAIIDELDLKNVTDENGKITLSKNVFDFESEIANVVKGLVISDYFFNQKYDSVLGSGLEAVVAKIKFNDKEMVLTSLDGEKTDTPIFYTKTFMNLRNRMEETERIEALWIMVPRTRGNITIKYGATNQKYIDVLVKYGIKFNESDMNTILEMYERYESKATNDTSKKCEMAVS